MLSGASNSSLPSSKPLNGESPIAESPIASSVGSNVTPMAQQVSRPNMPAGAAEGFGPGQQSRHPLVPQQPSGFGFSKYQLTLLRNQILAFKKLRARKV